MDLWIRSQNRKMMEKAVAIKIAHYTENETNSIVINNDYVFGEYATEERALEVLDKIQKFLENSCETYMQQHDNGLFSVVPVYLSRKTVFEMPKE